MNVTVNIFYDEKKQILFKVGGEKGLLSELGLAMMFGDTEQIRRILGKTRPEVEIAEDDEKLKKSAEDFNLLLDAFYKMNG